MINRHQLTRSEDGSVLVAVLAVMTLVLVLLGTLSTVVWTHLRSGTAYQTRASLVQRNSNAMEYAIASMRNSRTNGVSGSTQAWTYSGISVSCTASADSGVRPTPLPSPDHPGVNDRTVTCTSPLLTVRVRFYDRGGSADGVGMAIMSWKTNT